jgi:prepilin-type N-terminal cleavage/methylation domain-containing protein
MRAGILARHRDRLGDQQRLRPRDECGVTLPELLISIVILGLIIGPLSAAMVFFLQNGETANQIFRDDNTARLAAAYFTADVQSSTTVVTTVSGQCGTGTPLVTMSWNEDAVKHASTWYSANTATGITLARRQCRDGSEIAKNELGLLAASVPTITCTPSCSAPGTVTLEVSGADGFVFTINAAPRVKS